MKKIKYIIAIGGLSFATLAACTFSSNEIETKNSENSPESNHKYVCPMYCKGSGSDSAGTCPVCKMDYVLNKNIKK